MSSTAKSFSVLIVVLFVLSISAQQLDEEFRRDEILKALYRLNDHNRYRLFRENRSNGKPTFIRFGKRSSDSLFVDPTLRR